MRKKKLSLQIYAKNKQLDIKGKGIMILKMDVYYHVNREYHY